MSQQGIKVKGDDISKDTVAKLLMYWHFRVEPGMEHIYRIVSPIEDRANLFGNTAPVMKIPQFFDPTADGPPLPARRSGPAPPLVRLARIKKSGAPTNRDMEDDS